VAPSLAPPKHFGRTLPRSSQPTLRLHLLRHTNLASCKSWHAEAQSRVHPPHFAQDSLLSSPPRPYQRDIEDHHTRGSYHPLRHSSRRRRRRQQLRNFRARLQKTALPQCWAKLLARGAPIKRETKVDVAGVVPRSRSLAHETLFPQRQVSRSGSPMKELTDREAGDHGAGAEGAVQEMRGKASVQ